MSILFLFAIGIMFYAAYRMIDKANEVRIKVLQERFDEAKAFSITSLEMLWSYAHEVHGNPCQDIVPFEDGRLPDYIERAAGRNIMTLQLAELINHWGDIRAKLRQCEKDLAAEKRKRVMGIGYIKQSSFESWISKQIKENGRLWGGLGNSTHFDFEKREQDLLAAKKLVNEYVRSLERGTSSYTIENFQSDARPTTR